MWCNFRVLLLGLVLVGFSSQAGIALTAGDQTPAKLIPVENALIKKVAEALLHRVEGGVFQLQAGKSMDLTENKVLLTFRNIYNTTSRGLAEQKIVISLNGDTDLVVPGDRVDLLKNKASAKSLEGFTMCFLDYVSLLTPKGVPATATFRLHCE